jgi:hypothetical protein
MTRAHKTLGLTATAFAWAVALIPAAFLLPVYSGETSTTSISTAGGPVISSTVHTSSTFIGENGSGALIALALPAVLVALVAFALYRKHAHGTRRSGDVAWILVAMLGVFCVLGMFTIGLFVLPVVMLLACAAALRPAAPA